MQLINVEQVMADAQQHHRAGRLAEAEALYRQVLAHHSDHPGALHLLGLIAHHLGRAEQAAHLLSRTVLLQPNSADAHYNLGNALLMQRRFAEAVIAFSRAIELRSAYPQAHYNLGIAYKELSRPADAAAAYTRAIALKPDYAEAYANLGVALNDLEKPNEAIVAFSNAIRLNPSLPEAYYNLGNSLSDQGRLDEAVIALERAIQCQPSFVQAHNNLANVLNRLGRHDAALASCLAALRLRPEYAETYGNLGNIHLARRELTEAIAAYQRAIQLEPHLAGAHYNLGNALSAATNYIDAIAAYRKAIQLKPQFPEAHHNLARALSERGQLDEAMASCDHAITLRPGFADAHNLRGNLLKDQGLLDQALAAYDRAIALAPDQPAYLSNRLYALHFHPDSNRASLYVEHRRWQERFASELTATNTKSSSGGRDPNRRLKVGYVSPDFRDHPVGRFMLPLLKHHDRSRFEIFCYADVRRPDPMTTRLRNLCEHWIDIVTLSDDQAAAKISLDQIDLLLDLTMHMGDNRMRLFAAKPAPVQATYLAYCSTTGLDAMDYRLTDPHLEPPGLGDGFYSEKSICLAETWWCYEPPQSTPDIGPLPALRAGHITFGCLNNFCKTSSATLQTWASLLRQLPNSRLLLHAMEGSHRQRITNVLNEQSIDPARVKFVPHMPARDYFGLYQDIDMALDPFPWPGGTTTCDALWMGVPVITLSGTTAVSRSGVSILTNAGLPDLITSSPDQYIRRGIDLSSDLPALAHLRAALREKMLQSPLMNAPRFASHMESAYLAMCRDRA